MKTVIATTVFCLAAAFGAPAFADDMMACNNDNLMKVSQEAMKMTDQKAMGAAMEDLAMATKDMAAGKTDDCAMHLNSAMKATMAK